MCGRENTAQRILGIEEPVTVLKELQPLELDTATAGLCEHEMASLILTISGSPIFEYMMSQDSFGPSG